MAGGEPADDNAAKLAGRAEEYVRRQRWHRMREAELARRRAHRKHGPPR